MIDKWAAVKEIPVYEVPVGFKYFSSLLLMVRLASVGKNLQGHRSSKRTAPYGLPIKMAW